MARPRRKPKPDEDEPPRLPFPWWAKTLAVLASVAVLVTPFAILLTRRTRPRTAAQAHPGALASGGAAPPRLPATAHGSPWPLIAGMLIALALLVALTAWSRHARRHPARPPRDQARLALGESLAAGRAALAGPRDPRAAIIACYAAMERGFAAAGSAPAAADTPAEVLARATGAGLVRSGSAVRMAGLFRRARYSSEPMTSADSAAAAAALDQMQADLGPAMGALPMNRTHLALAAAAIGIAAALAGGYAAGGQAGLTDAAAVAAVGVLVVARGTLRGGKPGPVRPYQGGTGDDGQRGRLPRLPFDRLRPGVGPAVVAALPARRASAARPAGGRARPPGTGGSAAAARGRRRPRPRPGRAGPDDRRTGGAHVTEVLPVTVAETARLGERVLAEVEQVIVGKPEAVRLVLLGVLASGHILIEDLPGLGKTLLARTFATVLGLEFTRVQFTPDMLPADLTGATVLDLATGEAVFRPGPVFTGLLLADEINRTPPKTQAALLEAMAEGQVSTDGVTRPLPAPFVVLATDNPIEYEGTYPLPEAQLDRFIARVRLGYLDAEGEAEMVRRRLARGSTPPVPAQVTDASRLLAMRESLESVQLHPDLLAYVVALVSATRAHPQVTVGASPRGTLAVIQLARGHAALAGRAFVTPEDIKAVAVPALAHRLVLRPEMWVRQVTGEDVTAEVLATVPVPRGTPP